MGFPRGELQLQVTELMEGFFRGLKFSVPGFFGRGLGWGGLI